MSSSPSPLRVSSAAAPAAEQTGVIIVDHGSRRAESNTMLEAFVDRFAAAFPRFAIVEAAHMELAEPSIATAFARCVQRGARHVIVCPYFLLPGKHWNQDIPELARAAAEQHPGTSVQVTDPIGLHPMMGQIIASRIEECLPNAAAGA